MQIHIQIQSCHNLYNKDPEDRKHSSRPHLHHHHQCNRTCHHTSSKIQLFDHCYIGILEQIQMDMNNHIQIQMQIHNHIHIQMQIHNHSHTQMQIHNHIHTLVWTTCLIDASRLLDASGHFSCFLRPRVSRFLLHSLRQHFWGLF